MNCRVFRTLHSASVRRSTLSEHVLPPLTEWCLETWKMLLEDQDVVDLHVDLDDVGIQQPQLE